MAPRLTHGLMHTLLCLGTGLLQPSARAEDAHTGWQADAAKMLYEQAVDAYAEQRYADALALFERADQFNPSAAYSYNIARTQEALGRKHEAASAYREYLERAADPADAARVRQRIARLEEVRAPSELDAAGAVVVIRPAPRALARVQHSGPVVAHRAPTRARQATTSSEPSRAREARTPVLKTVGAVTLITSGALLGGSLVFEILRRDAESEARTTNVQLAYADKIDTMKSRQLASRALLGAGAGLAVVGGVLWLSAPGTSAVGEDARLALACSTHGCEVSAVGRY